MKRIEHWPDLGYTCVVEYDADPYYVEWKLYTLFDGGPGERFWQKDGSISSPDPVDSLDLAEVYAEGSTKWDGCSNFSFCDGDRGVDLHTCTREDLINIGNLLARVHDFCGHVMKKQRNFDPQPLPESVP